ncbi:MAG: MurR/RpiR family transcriptional regulator [Anaerolineaceae bacterium]
MISEKENDLEFNKLVAKCYDFFTHSEKRIAEFISQNHDEVAFMSAAEVANKLNLSEPTMLRFAKRLGFDSYPAMRIMLQTKVRNLANHSARIRSSLDDLRNAGDLYEQLVTSEIDFLTESLQTLDRDAIKQATELLRTHERIYVFGLGPSVSLVDQLDIRLTRSLKHVIPLRTSGRELIEPLLLMTGDDLVIAIAFHSVNPLLELVLDRANEFKVPVILITDTLGDLIGSKATVTLASRRGPVSAFHSLTIPMTIINTLLLALTAADQDRIMNNLDQLDQLRESVKRTSNNTNSRKKN